MDKPDLLALIKLIDDEDKEVYGHVREKLRELHDDDWEVVREFYLRSETELQHQRLKQLLDERQLLSVQSALRQWAQGGAIDLLDGYFIVAQYRYPQLEKEPIVHFLDKMKLDIWLRLNHKFSQLDNVRVLNDVFFGKYRFQGDQENYFAPENSYINQVIERRKGNPIALSILYSIIAQKLYLPILGVNLPQHFILAYKDDQALEKDERFNNTGIIPWDIKGEVLFYINPFNGGAVFSKYNIDRFISQTTLSTERHYYEPCSNIVIISRVLRNLQYAYEKMGDAHRQQEVNQLLLALNIDENDK